MELTPTGRSLRPRHVPTPKFEERKRKLFERSARNAINENEDEDEDSDLGPMSPLESSSSPSSFHSRHGIIEEFNVKNKTTFHDILCSTKKSAEIESKFHLKEFYVNLGKRVIMNDEINNVDSDDGVAPLCASMETMANVTDTPKQTTSMNVFHKENYAQQMKTPSELVTSSLSEPIAANRQSFRKSMNLHLEHTPHENDHSSMIKPDKECSSERPKAKTSLTFLEPVISTKSFYGASSTSSNTWISSLKSNTDKKLFTTPKSKTRSDNYTSMKRVAIPKLWQGGNAIKHVRHRHFVNRSSKKRKHDCSSTTENSSSSSDSIERPRSAKKLRRDIDLNPTTPVQQKSILKDQNSFSPWESSRRSAIKKVGKKSVKTAATMNEASDASGEEEDDVDEDEDLLLHMNLVDNIQNADPIKEERTNRKFFKSGRDNTTKNYHILNSFNASLKRGNNLVLEVPTKRQKMNKKLKKEIKSLIDKLSSPSKNYKNQINNKADDKEKEINKPMEIEVESTASQSFESYLNQQQPETSQISVNNPDDYYQKIIPYNTSDPEKISQQESILQLLISNGICNEETFKVFIAEPDLHKERASEILDSLYCVSDLIPDSSDTFPQIATITTFENESSEIIENVVTATTSEDNNDSNAITSVDINLFPVFRKSNQSIQTPRNTLPNFSSNLNANKWKPIGNDQYQIDAGQKKFGMTQCAECGMNYSIHEPEDELLHSRFHNSINTLTFKGWTDERGVCEVPEWGIGGRIIYICETDKKVKKSRVKEVLDVVDRDLGFAVTELLPKSLVYFGIAKNRIIGVFVVNSLQEANRLVHVDGIDCCTKESYPVKCGISRIWISPNYRRMGVASKILSTIRSHFIFGYYLSIDDIAFSSPTEAGKRFAIQFTGRNDFLVYER